MARTAHTAALVERFERGGAELPGAMLAGLRREALAAFAERGFPTQRDEDWKYTSLDRLARADFDPLAGAGGGVDLSAWADFLVPDAWRVVVVNGRADPESLAVDGTPEGVSITPLSAAVEDPGGVRPGAAGGAPLTALNTAFMRDGLALTLADGAVMDRPVQILHVAFGTDADIALHPRSVIVAGAGSRAQVIETFVGGGAAQSWTNAVTEFRLGRGARVSHVKLQAEDARAGHTALVEVRLEGDAQYDATALATGAALSRNEIRVALDGPGADCRIHGGVLLRGRQHGDNTTGVDHRAGHATSAQVFRNVLDDRARSVFQGGVAVSPGAAGTNSSQSARSLLLAPGTRADSKPELRILADDVKCAHGATVGDLDRDALFYLVSRGVPPDEARTLLIRAFVAEVLDAVPDGGARDHLERAVTAWMRGAAP